MRLLFAFLFTVSLAHAGNGTIPITQYTCLFGAHDRDPRMQKYHFYFVPTASPDAIPESRAGTFCHDLGIYGRYDDLTYPRLEEIQNAFTLWTDAYVQQVPGRKLFFDKLLPPRTEGHYERAGNKTALKGLGWVRHLTANQSCPGNQGLYSAVLARTDNDYVLIEENMLERIRFYSKDGVPTRPAAQDIGKVTLFFHYPPNPSAPLKKFSTQHTYRVERKLGCVPKS